MRILDESGFGRNALVHPKANPATVLTTTEIANLCRLADIHLVSEIRQELTHA